MYKVVKFPPKRTLEIAQKCMLGFLIAYKKLIERLDFTNAVELLQEEERIVSENQINDYDREILSIIKILKFKFNTVTVNQYLELIQKEIDILATDISISTSNT